MHSDTADLPIRERLQHWVEQLTHVLPAQAPIRDFVHHNTLHGFQQLRFPDALGAAQRLLGVSPYWSEAKFMSAYAAGRISRDDLLAAFDDAGLNGLDEAVIRGLSRRDVLLASLLNGPMAPAAHRQAWVRREQGAAREALDERCDELADLLTGEADGAAWETLAQQRWADLCARVGAGWTLRSLLAHLTGEDVLEKVRSSLQRHLAAHLDLGVAAWRNPERSAGFYAAWRASACLDLGWELEDQHTVRDELLNAAENPLDVLVEELQRIMPDEQRWPDYLERLALELPGWSGMFLWRDRNPGRGDGTRVDMLDYLAVRVLLERLLCDEMVRRLTGSPMNLDELREHFACRPAEFLVRDALHEGRLSEALTHRAAYLVSAGEGHGVRDDDWEALAAAIAGERQAHQVTALGPKLRGLFDQLELRPAEVAALLPADVQAIWKVSSELTELARGHVWLLAYERHYREQLFAALAANHARPQRAAPSVSAHVIFCMDDREEGTRRHLEEIAPNVLTLGAAGFFGVPMYWQGLDDAGQSALCPVVVQPNNLVTEHVAPEAGKRLKAYVRQRSSRLRWRAWLYQGTRRHPVLGTLLGSLAGAPALAALAAFSLAPAWFGSSLRRWRQSFDGVLPTELALTTPDTEAGSAAQPKAGFADGEQADRVEGFLRMIGLTEGFAPLVLIFGHGSSSRNNPHFSAYDCGACSGKHGGPNARVFAAMANRPEVRAVLAGRGLVIPDACWFVGAEHNTCDDSIEWYDLSKIPAAFQPALDTLVAQLAEACRAHAAERCRRLASAPPGLSPWQGLQHVAGRASDVSQARPELGHANNAAAFIGRREMSRGLFLDRRVFLISYDPTADLAGHIVEAILLAAGPVGAGISLEYYFSSVDNERLGCGSKITHNVTGLFGVMEGADSDLRTGLPWQMVEIHEPMRLLVVVEQSTEVLTAILARQPALQELIKHEWIIFAAKSPSTVAIDRYCPRRGWLPWSGKPVLPQVARSVDWFAGEREALDPALILGGAR